jgi:hypothetical protein
VARKRKAGRIQANVDPLLQAANTPAPALQEIKEDFLDWLVRHAKITEDEAFRFWDKYDGDMDEIRRTLDSRIKHIQANPWMTRETAPKIVLSGPYAGLESVTKVKAPAAQASDVTSSVGPDPLKALSKAEQKLPPVPAGLPPVPPQGAQSTMTKGQLRYAKGKLLSKGTSTFMSGTDVYEIQKTLSVPKKTAKWLLAAAGNDANKVLENNRARALAAKGTKGQHALVGHPGREEGNRLLAALLDKREGVAVPRGGDVGAPVSREAELARLIREQGDDIAADLAEEGVPDMSRLGRITEDLDVSGKATTVGASIGRSAGSEAAVQATKTKLLEKLVGRFSGSSVKLVGEGYQYNPNALMGYIQLLEDRLLAAEAKGGAGSKALSGVASKVDALRGLKDLVTEIETNPERYLKAGALSDEAIESIIGSTSKAFPDELTEWALANDYKLDTFRVAKDTAGNKVYNQIGRDALHEAGGIVYATDPTATSARDKWDVPYRKAGHRDVATPRPAGAAADTVEAVASTVEGTELPSGGGPKPISTPAKPVSKLKQVPEWLKGIGRGIKSAVTDPNTFLAGGAESRLTFEAAKVGAGVSIPKALGRLAMSPGALLAMVVGPMAIDHMIGGSQSRQHAAERMSPEEHALRMKMAKAQQQRTLQTVMSHPVLSKEYMKQLAEAQQAQMVQMMSVPGKSSSDTY